MKKVSIIGFGRFGQLLSEILSADYKVEVFDVKDKFSKVNNENIQFVDLETALSNDTIFYAVPINKFKSIFKSHLQYLQKSKKGKLLVDVLSVKTYPKKILNKYLPRKHQALLTHPLFGPDSYKKNKGLDGLRIVLDKNTASDKNYDLWKKYFENKKMDVIEMSARAHDKRIANSQGALFYMGRSFEKFGYEKSEINTFWADKLYKIIYGSVCKDSWELFEDLQHYNPYTEQMRLNVRKSFNYINKKLLESRESDRKIIGIQGGKGSFNEEAVLSQIEKYKISDYKIKYLYTTNNVLEALELGDINIGQFAIHNSTGGIVEESIKAMGKYQFTVDKEFGIIISHALMRRTDAKDSDIKTIMTHPQVLKQCRENLEKKYPDLEKVSGKGELIDHAEVAKQLSEKKLDKDIAVMGSSILADIYDLEVIEDNLQDLENNFTSFLWVKR